MLVGGERCFGAMLDAIAQAEKSISLMSYIFDSDRAGLQFVEALGDAVNRGVEVRVLVDAAGSRYSRPGIHNVLRGAGVVAALFLQSWVPFRLRYANLRNHRKTMVVDGRIGFTGGMNIREGVLAELSPPSAHPIQDVHARIEGPAVAQIQRVFAEDWAFTTGEALADQTWPLR